MTISQPAELPRTFAVLWGARDALGQLITEATGKPVEQKLTTDYAIAIFHAACRGETYSCYLGPESTLPMIYMPDAIRATTGAASLAFFEHRCTSLKHWGVDITSASRTLVCVVAFWA